MLLKHVAAMCLQAGLQVGLQVGLALDEWPLIQSIVALGTRNGLS